LDDETLKPYYEKNTGQCYKREVCNYDFESFFHQYAYVIYS